MNKLIIIALLICGAAFGQLSNAKKIQGRAVCTDTPADTNVLGWSASRNCWVATAGGGGSATPGGASGDVQVNNGSGGFGAAPMNCSGSSCSIGATLLVGAYTIAAGAHQLPAASSGNNNYIATVTDGTSGSDCTTGGGSSKALCISNGSAWISLGGGSATWGTITGTLSSQSDLNTALSAKAPLASPTFTGTPAAPTASANTNTTQLATTAFVLGQASSSNPAMDGSAAAGTGTTFARADHVHPTDTTRAPITACVNAQTGTSYTLQASDRGCVVTLNNPGAVTLTVPSGLGVGFNCLVVQLGTGAVTPTASSTTINQRQGLTRTAGQYASISLFAYVADTFDLTGDLQ